MPPPLLPGTFICTACRLRLRHVPRRPTLASSPRPPRTRRRNSSKAPPSSSPEPQKDDYYALLLASPLPTDVSSAKHAAPVVPPSEAVATTTLPQSSSPPPSDSPPTSREARARLIFSSRLVGPAPRPAGSRLQKPEEPDNCCMSGCVNCVWDTYREELEAWAQARKERGTVLAEGSGAAAVGGTLADADGGGEAAGAEWDTGGLFSDIPVGIREFMRLEKKLKGDKVGVGG